VVIPLFRIGEYTPGTAINIELSPAQQQAKPMTSWRLFGNLPLAKADDTNVVATAECMEDRAASLWRW
jgi:hypothetical protein